jgi:hypothetical protein
MCPFKRNGKERELMRIVDSVYARAGSKGGRGCLEEDLFVEMHSSPGPHQTREGERGGCGEGGRSGG